jgi:hypothetical protein
MSHVRGWRTAGLDLRGRERRVQCRSWFRDRPRDATVRWVGPEQRNQARRDGCRAGSLLSRPSAGLHSDVNRSSPGMPRGGGAARPCLETDSVPELARKFKKWPTTLRCVHRRPALAVARCATTSPASSDPRLARRRDVPPAIFSGTLNQQRRGSQDDNYQRVKPAQPCRCTTR